VPAGQKRRRDGEVKDFLSGLIFPGLLLKPIIFGRKASTFIGNAACRGGQERRRSVPDWHVRKRNGKG